MTQKRIKVINVSGETFYPYQLRVDCSASAFIVRDDPSANPFGPARSHYYTSPFYNYLKINFTYFLVGEEISTEGKPHWQCFLLTKNIIEDKSRVAMRSLIKRRYSSLDTKQPVSFKKSFAPAGLFKYVQKEGRIFSNMPEFMLVHLEKMHKKRQKELGNKANYETVEQIAKRSQNMTDFIQKVVNNIKKKLLTKVPRKTILWKIALQSGLVTPTRFAQEFYSYYGEYSS